MGPRLRATALAALTVVMTGTLALTGLPAQAHPGQPGDVFDPDSVSWWTLRDRTPAQFDADINTAHDNDRIPVDIDADTSGASVRLAGVYQRNLDNRDWVVLHGLTNAMYSNAWTNLADSGFRLADFETYLLDGTRFYNGLWVENVEGYGWTSSRNMDVGDYLNFINNARNAGRMLIDIDAWETGAGTRYAAISVTNDDNLDWAVHISLTENNYSTIIDNTAATMRPLVGTSVTTAAGQRYSIILVENANGRDKAERHDLTSANFGLVWSAFASAGFRHVGFDRYDTAAGVRYLGIWRQND
jgi:hypothetical protein